MDKDYLLKKYLANELSEEELAEFKKLEHYNQYIKIQNGLHNFKASHFSELKHFDELEPKLKSHNFKKKVIPLYSFRNFLKIASILLLGFAVYFLFFFNRTTTVETLVSQRTVFELPDASVVSLNAGSKLAYNKRKWHTKRMVKLDGEAFFKVKKGSTFDVVSSNGVVQVVGTQFNVKNRDDYFEVVCYEGVVKVVTANNEYNLPKGKTLQYIDGVTKLDSTVLKQPDWLGNESTFKSVPLKMVVSELERQYGIKVKSENIDLDRLFSGGFVNNNLEQALISITVPFNLNYSKENSNTYTIYSIEK